MVLAVYEIEKAHLLLLILLYSRVYHRVFIEVFVEGVADSLPVPLPVQTTAQHSTVQPPALSLPGQDQLMAICYSNTAQLPIQRKRILIIVDDSKGQITAVKKNFPIKFLVHRCKVWLSNSIL